MKYLYELYHTYEEDGIDVFRPIGIYSSYEKAEEVAKKLFLKPGFSEHPYEAFLIDTATLDRVQWNEGFISWDEASYDEDDELEVN